MLEDEHCREFWRGHISRNDRTHTKKSALKGRPPVPRACQPPTPNQIVLPHTTSSTMPFNLFSTSASLRVSSSHSFAHSSTSSVRVVPSFVTTFEYWLSSIEWPREVGKNFVWSRMRRRNANVGRFSSRAAGVMVNDFGSLEVRLARIPGSESLAKNEGGTSSVCSA